MQGTALGAGSHDLKEKDSIHKIKVKRTRNKERRSLIPIPQREKANIPYNGPAEHLPAASMPQKADDLSPDLSSSLLQNKPGPKIPVQRHRHKLQRLVDKPARTNPAINKAVKNPVGAVPAAPGPGGGVVPGIPQAPEG